MSSQFTAIVPIKFNSERVKGKNFRILNGRPLYNWIVDTLLTVERIERIVINTDVPEKISSDAFLEDTRVHVDARPVELHGDEVSMNLILKAQVENESSSHFFMTHTTNPFLSEGSINQALDKYCESVMGSESYDSLFSVTQHQSRFFDLNGTPLNHDPENLIPTQELPKMFEENSCFYVFPRDVILKYGRRIGEHPLMYPIALPESLDIDTEQDWRLAELLAPAIKHRDVGRES